jgi:hypothetical protein
LRWAVGKDWDYLGSYFSRKGYGVLMMEDPSEKLVIIVTGSRVWDKPYRVHLLLDSYDPFIVVEGGCPSGADADARVWCRLRGMIPRTYPADWDRHGKPAGNIRNIEMIDAWKKHPNVRVIGFPQPNGTGTQHCMAYARSVGMTVEDYGDVK